jgi:hypothetical protein
MQRILIVFCVSGVAWTAVGCGSRSDPAERLVPVAGNVTVAGQPWKIGEVGFFPDASKGNQCQQSSIGVLDADGNYELYTAGKPGAPLGWYKVVVWSPQDPNAAGNPWGPDGKLKPIKWLVNAKYTCPETTDLAVEVVEKPTKGMYDLHLSK